MTKYNKDNVLGWTGEEFDDLICEIVNLRISNNMTVHPAYQRVYFDHGQKWLKKRWGMKEEENMKSELEIIHMIIKKTIKKCNLMHSKDYKKNAEFQDGVAELDKEIQTLLACFKGKHED